MNMAGELLKGSGDVLHVMFTTLAGFNKGMARIRCLCDILFWCGAGMAKGRELMLVFCLRMLLLLRDKGTGDLSRPSRLRHCRLWVFNNKFCV